MSKMFNPPHPGGQLKEAIENSQATVEGFAAEHGIDPAYLRHVVACEAAITPELSHKLTGAFKQPTRDLWYRMQAEHDEWHAA